MMAPDRLLIVLTIKLFLLYSNDNIEQYQKSCMECISVSMEVRQRSNNRLIVDGCMREFAVCMLYHRSRTRKTECIS